MIGLGEVAKTVFIVQSLGKFTTRESHKFGLLQR